MRSPNFPSGRCSASSTAPPGGDRGQAPRSAPSSAGSPLRWGSGVGSRRTSCATRTRWSSPARGSRSTSSSASSGTPTSALRRSTFKESTRGDHRRRPHTTRPDDVGQRRPATLIDRIATRERLGAPAFSSETRTDRECPRDRRRSSVAGMKRSVASTLASTQEEAPAQHRLMSDVGTRLAEVEDRRANALSKRTTAPLDEWAFAPGASAPGDRRGGRAAAPAASQRLMAPISPGS
jgi:hypothetical protein